MATKAQQVPRGANDTAAEEDGRGIIEASRSSEIFLAVVGPVGAGASRARGSLERACREAGYQVETLKVSSLIRTWGDANGHPLPAGLTPIDKVRHLQDVGDRMRSADPTRVARETLASIASLRAARTGTTFVQGTAIAPGSDKVAYIIDSIRHPAETSLFRRTYANAFALVGVVCEEKERRNRILDKFYTGPQRRDERLIAEADAFIGRDADDENAPHGQRGVATRVAAFELAPTHVGDDEDIGVELQLTADRENSFSETATIQARQRGDVRRGLERLGFL